MGLRTKHFFSCLLVLALGCFLSRFSAWSQTAATGQIAGNVTDPSKAVVPQATVTATNEATSSTRSVKTNGDGDYAIPLLPPGNYSVTIEANGFKKQTFPHVLVEVASTATVNIRLQIGEASETVTIEAAAELLQTEGATNGGIVDDKTGLVPSFETTS
jgi:hypothetical protein